MKSHRRRKSKSKSKCKEYLRRKIAINIDEFNNGYNFVSKSQAIAVSYNQVNKRHPACKRILRRKK